MLQPAVPRGAQRPSEIASRLGTAQTNLSRLLQQLVDASIVQREIPWGESTRTTKRVHYRIADPSTRFWFGVYSAHRSRWASYPSAKRRALVHEHAATVFEDHCRAQFSGAGRYWESDLELDLVAPDPEDPDALVIAEVKWRRLSARDRKRTMAELQAKWSRCKLRDRHPRARLVVLDQAVLAEA